ncbi:MAG: hypothetical protein J6Z22_05550 [Lachnospiraceae bacterium]|nr:hypothetical protein [Lachnospiraceae bacterium]
MIRLVISVPGKFYSDAITKALEKTGNFRVQPLELPVERDGPEVALLGVSVHQGFTLEERKEVIKELKERAPKCRIVLFLDELISPEQTEGVKNLKQARLIDGFLYASGTMEYLVATLESI